MHSQPSLRLAGDEPLPNRGNSDTTFSDIREDVFQQVVEDNANVCSRCFFRHRTRQQRPNTEKVRIRGDNSPFYEYEIPPPDPGNQFTWQMDWNYHRTDTLDDRLGRDYVPDEIGGGEYATVDGGRRRYCRNCGVIGTNTAERCRTKFEAVKAAFTLSHTLKEYEIPHDPRHLIESVRGMKGTSPLNTNDKRIFEIAAENAVTLAERGITEQSR